jgi:hypothetical protein
LVSPFLLAVRLRRGLSGRLLWRTFWKRGPESMRVPSTLLPISLLLGVGSMPCRYRECPGLPVD